MCSLEFCKLCIFSDFFLHISENMLTQKIWQIWSPAIGRDSLGFVLLSKTAPACTFASHSNLQMNRINIWVAMQWRARARAIKEVKTKFLDEKRAGTARAFYNHLHKKKRNLKLRKEVVETWFSVSFFGIVRRKDKNTKIQKYKNTKRQKDEKTKRQNDKKKNRCWTEISHEICNHGILMLGWNISWDL